MRIRYEQGATLQEVANWLASEQMQAYWTAHLGREYRPSQKVVNKVAVREGFRLRKRGASGRRNGSWKGGRTTDKSGYILVYTPGHPDANCCGYVREHRLVMEMHLGRRLSRLEVVHHRDGNRANNCIDNLQLFAVNSDHLRHELTGRTPNWTPEGFAKMCAPRPHRRKTPACTS